MVYKCVICIEYENNTDLNWCLILLCKVAFHKTNIIVCLIKGIPARQMYHAHYVAETYYIYSASVLNAIAFVDQIFVHTLAVNIGL